MSFEPELPEQVPPQSSSVAATIGKVILALVVIGATIISLPFVFCGSWILLGLGGGLGIFGPIIGGVAVIFVIILASWIIKKIFKH